MPAELYPATVSAEHPGRGCGDPAGRIKIRAPPWRDAWRVRSPDRIRAPVREELFSAFWVICQKFDAIQGGAEQSTRRFQPKASGRSEALIGEWQPPPRDAWIGRSLGCMEREYAVYQDKCPWPVPVGMRELQWLALLPEACNISCKIAAFIHAWQRETGVARRRFRASAGGQLTSNLRNLIRCAVRGVGLEARGTFQRRLKVSGEWGTVA